MPLALRLVLTLLLLTGISMLAVWLRDHPGLLRLDWLGYRVETPMAIATPLALITLLFFGLLLYGLVHLSYFPLRLRLRKQETRFHHSLDQLTYAMTSLAVGDDASALRYARQAEKYLGQHPLLELVHAHVALRGSDNAGARHQLQKLMHYPTTRMLAASALSRAAQRDERLEEAVRLGLTAYELQPNHLPNLQHLFVLYVEMQDWQAALLLLERARRRGSLSKQKVMHYEAILYWQEAESLRRTGHDTGHALLIRQAFNSEAGFVPAAHAYATHLAATGHRRRAIMALRKAWRQNPHPMLADLFLNLQADMSAVKRHKAVELLTQTQPQHLESHVLRARTAIQLKEWSQARHHLGRAHEQASQARLFRMLAEIEQQEGQEANALHAMEQASNAPRDPQWVCDGCGSMHAQWQFICHHCQSADSIQWRTPQTAIIESERLAVPYGLHAAH